MKTFQCSLTLRVLGARQIVLNMELFENLTKQIRGEIRSLIALNDLRDSKQREKLSQSF